MTNKVDIYEGWCKKCGICIAFCPEHALEEDEEGFPKLSSPEKCTGCGWCEIRCPDFAIVVSNDEKTEKS